MSSTQSDPAAHGPSHQRRLRSATSSARVRILGWFVLLLAAALVIAGFLQRGVLYNRLDDRVADELLQERDELLALQLDGRDPETGRALAEDVSRLLTTFLEGNLPLDREAQLAFVNGDYLAGTPTEAAASLLNYDQITAVARVQTETTGELTTAEGDVRYLAVPVTDEAGDSGVLVVAQFMARERSEIDAGLRAIAGVGVTTLLLGAILAWFAAGRVLAPLRQLGDTARTITDSDLSKRIDVRGDDDEISRLATTFNDMLDRLETAFEQQRRFIDEAGHELRTPITIIGGHLELLGDDPEEREETVAIVTDELDRMARMVEDLLLLARSEQPDFLTLAPVDIGVLTSECFAKATALGQRDWRLDATASGTMIADRHRLTQAMMQLAVNATQHTEPGAEIGIGSRHTDDGVVLWVRDTGEGVAQQDRDRIFERFARGDRQRQRSQGAGLGLSIVKAIAEAHAGRVEAEHRSGGATFTLFVPDRHTREARAR